MRLKKLIVIGRDIHILDKSKKVQLYANWNSPQGQELAEKKINQSSSTSTLMQPPSQPFLHPLKAFQVGACFYE